MSGALNHLKKFLLLALGASVGFFFALEGRAAQTNKFTAEIKQVIGGAAVNGAVAKKGMIVSEGATIVTGPDSSVTFVIKEFKAVIRLQSQSTLSLDKIAMNFDYSSAGKVAFIDLKGGAFVASVSKINYNLNRGDRFEIKTAKAADGVREPSDFKVGADGTVHCRKGNIMFINRIGSVQAPWTITSGESIQPATIPGSIPTISPTPPDLAAALDKEIKELKKLAGYR
ncbi:MAG: hypothetical protein HZA89_01715 [Verrucomicrobia bacterium]|nr:hypothetical protein [Verrucomicrobiota bacterium]